MIKSSPKFVPFVMSMRRALVTTWQRFSEIFGPCRKHLELNMSAFLFIVHIPSTTTKRLDNALQELGHLSFLQ